jgi:hypothetical protein
MDNRRAQSVMSPFLFPLIIALLACATCCRERNDDPDLQYRRGVQDALHSVLVEFNNSANAATLDGAIAASRLHHGDNIFMCARNDSPIYVSTDRSLWTNGRSNPQAIWGFVLDPQPDGKMRAVCKRGDGTFVALSGSELEQIDRSRFWHLPDR